MSITPERLDEIILSEWRRMGYECEGQSRTRVIEQQTKEIAELKRSLAEEQEVSSDGLLIAHLNGAASARDRIRELEALAKKMADALDSIQDRNLAYLRSPFVTEIHEQALSAYREVIKP